MKIFSAQLKGTTIVVEGATASLTGSFTGSVAGIDINATNTFTASTIARLNSIETISSSNDGRVNSLESFTSSTSARLNSIETISASNVARISSLETTSASVDSLNVVQNSRLSSLEVKTGSLATTGSNTFIGTQTITGSLYISSDLIVQGSSSLQNITASAVSIGTNIINLNTANPAIRYAGLSIGDSGSVGSSGSFLYDSVQDEFIFVHRGANTTVTSSVLLMGPQTYDNIGNETYLTTNRIPKGAGNEHLVDSNISDDGNIVQIQNTTLAITGSRVGINTSFPTQALEVSGSITTNNTFYISKTPSDTVQQGPGVYLVGGSGASYTQLQQGVDRFIIFGFNGSSWVERLTINNTNGRVGIGITNPEYSLDVNGAARFGSSTYKILSISDAGGAGWATTGGASTSPQLYMFNTGTNAIVQTYINNTARLEVSNSGISVTGASTFGSSTTNGDVTIITNATPFVIRGRTTYDRAFLGLTWDISPDAAILYGNTIRFNVNPTFGTNAGTTAMTILADGKIGIGVTSPISQLHIRTLVASGERPTNLATSATKSAVYFTTIAGSSAGMAFGQIGANTNYIQATYENGSSSTPLSLNPYGGKVGIGTDAPDNSYQGLTIFGTDPSLRLKTSSSSGWVWTEYVTSAGTNNFSMGVNQTAPYFAIRAGAGLDNPQFRMDTSGKIGMNTNPSTNSQLNVGGSLRVNNSVYNWYQSGTNSWDNFSFLHLKTNMSSGASGNVDHTMSLFTGRLYSYSSAYIREGSFGFHNWSGILYNPVTTGNFWSGGYSSSDGFVVLVVAIGPGSYVGMTIDWHQSYPYGFRDRIVTAVSPSNSSSGVY